jgi:hypothetical protein
MTNSLTPSDARTLRSELHEQDRVWRHGFEAGLREHRCLVIVGVVIAALVLFRRHLNPLIALAWTLLVVLAFAPLLLAVLAISVTIRTHRRWRSWRRTLAMATTWLGGVGLVAAFLVLAWPPLVLIIVPAGVVAWVADSHLRTRRELRFSPPYRTSTVS